MQRLDQIKVHLQENFGANLLVEKEFPAGSPGSLTNFPNRGQSHELVRSTSRRKSHHKKHEHDLHKDHLRKSRSPKVKTENEEKVKSSSPARQLIQALTAYKAPVTDDTILLINAAEVLARDGIHGKIAAIGVGFGTGRHTSIRRCGSAAKGPYKKLPQKQSPEPKQTKKTHSVANEALIDK